MKELFMRMAVGLIVLMVFLNACASDPYVRNIKSKSDLKADEKVLAGRFACFENDAPVHCTKSHFFIFFNREGDRESKLFRPDDGGYVHIAVTEGYYNMATFAKGAKDGRGLIFDLDSFPVVLIRSEDSIVNFGTLEVRFYTGPESKDSTAQSGGGRPQLRINHIENYDVTRSEIVSRVGKSAGSISNGSVRFLQRARR